MLSQTKRLVGYQILTLAITVVNNEKARTTTERAILKSSSVSRSLSWIEPSSNSFGLIVFPV